MFKKNEIKHKVEEYIINHKIDISRYDLYQIMDLYDDNKDELCGYSFNYLSKERSEGKATCFCVLYEFPDIINRGNDEIQINYLWFILFLSLCVNLAIASDSVTSRSASLVKQ